MKKISIYIAILVSTLFIVSCTQTEKLPPAVSSVAEVATRLKGKTWQVVDIATVTGLQISYFDKDPANKVPAAAPATENLNWLSARKGAEKNNEFINEYYDKNLKISFAFNNDSVVTTTGMDAQKQIFSIENSKNDDKTKGIKLLLTGEGEPFENMGVSKFTATYYILGANEKKLILLTPNELNRAKVVYLLEAE